MTDAERTLTQVERDRIATYADSNASTPWWAAFIPLAGGVALASQDIEQTWLAIVVAIAAAAAIGALTGLMLRRAGAIPNFREMPAPLRRVMVGYYIVAGIGLAGILIWAYTTDVTLAFVRAGAAFTVLIIIVGWLSEVAYQRRARVLIEESNGG